LSKGHVRLAALLFAASLSLCSSGSVFAQAEVPAARKFDEFGDVPASDLAARLDNFANELQTQTGAKGFMIAYRSRRDLPGLSGRLVSLMRNYLVETRGLAAERVAAVDGGVAGCVAQELWLVPAGAAPVPRADAYQSDFEDTDSTRKYDEAPLDAQDSYHNTIYDSLEGYANALRKEPRSTAYLVAYAQYYISEWQEEDERGRKRTRRSVELDPPAVAARALRSFKNVLARKYAISPSRFKLVNGGYRKWAMMELWIVPRGGHAPIPTPNAFPKGRR